MTERPGDSRRSVRRSRVSDRQGGRATTARSKRSARKDTGTARVVRSQVEPRLVERRQHVAAAQRRARRRRFAVVAALAALPLIGAVVAFSPLLGVSEIEVSGLERLSEREVLRATGIELGTNMVDADLAEMRRAAMAEPLVASAHVTRHWPTTIRIEVVEEQPLVRVHDGGDPVAVLSRSGRVLDPALFAGETLPSVRLEGASLMGSGGSISSGGTMSYGDDLDDRIRPALRVFEVLPDHVADRLSDATISSSGAVELELDGSLVVRLGSLDSLPAKLLSLTTVLEQVSPECMSVLDLTEPTRPTVARRDDCTPAEVTVASPEPMDGAGADDGTGAESGGVSEG